MRLDEDAVAHTTLPRWGRDQNGSYIQGDVAGDIPHCPVGGEIKTLDSGAEESCEPYHTAPLGARSKLAMCTAQTSLDHTTLPRWGRDQNQAAQSMSAVTNIPHCPVGGEIKTSLVLRWRLAQAYHTAPLGARSKLNPQTKSSLSAHTTLPRWGRDQNQGFASAVTSRTIPHCPVGGEIKTPRSRCPA